MDDWYQLTKEQVLEKINSDLQNGLNGEEVDWRLQEYGPNGADRTRR